MRILPAIDLYDRKAVRLLHGDYAQMTVYSDCPLDVAQSFAAAGAQEIHMVDLQGARDGDTPNLPVVAEIARKTKLRIEIGGGIRDLATAERYFACGVARVILGTAAITDDVLLRAAVALYGDRIAVGADVKDGRIAIRGWREQSPVTLDAFLDRMVRMGVRTVICTDISKDGAMHGTNLPLYRDLCARYPLDIIASGGVSTLDDVRALRNLGAAGAIIGKAYYTGAIDLAQALEVAQ